MTSQNKNIELWAQERNIPTNYNSAVQTEVDGMRFSVGFVPNLGDTITAQIAEGRVSKEVRRAINDELKPLGANVTNGPENLLHCSYRVKRGENYGETLDRILSTFADALRTSGLNIDETCSICHQPGATDGVEKISGYLAPAHTECKNDIIGQQLSQIAENEVNGNYLFGIIGAVVGGLVASLPALLFIILANTMITVLYFLIPLGAAFGYQKAKGIENGFMKVIVAVVSVVVVILSYGTYAYNAGFLYDYNALTQAGKVYNGTKSASSVSDQYQPIDDYVELYPVILEVMQEEEIGDKISFSTLSKLFPVKEFYHDGMGFFGFIISGGEEGLWSRHFLGNIIFALISTLVGVFVSMRSYGRNTQTKKQLQEQLEARQRIQVSPTGEDPFTSSVQQSTITKTEPPLPDVPPGMNLGKPEDLPSVAPSEVSETPVHDELFRDVLEDDSKDQNQ